MCIRDRYQRRVHGNSMKSLILVLAIVATCSAQIHLVPGAVMPQSRAFDFITGFLEGLNEKGDINKLLNCVKGIDQIIDNIVEGVRLISVGGAENIIVGVTKVITSVKELLGIFKPCSEGFKQIKKLFEAFRHINILKVVFKILNNPKPYVTDVVKAVEAFKKKDFHEGGKRVGRFLFNLFLTNSTEVSYPKMELDDVLDLIDGFFSGLNTNGDFNNLAKCAKQLPIIVDAVKDLIAKFKDLNKLDLQEFVKAALAVINAARSLVNVVLPCKGTYEDFKMLIKMVQETDFKKRFELLWEAEFHNLLHYLSKGMQELKEGQFYDGGESLGKLVYILLLKKL
eukprot:TRINITY_DN2873_c0_g1_i5.p1 TRINITY_DN2873_c0_g1~~TRINITY_DN2873_c0_g1_i5.p1  ORF type:complete len:340 (-),score=121.94 TRINITY_DN2873_c0_g1_i5:107-1126(-)